MIIEEIFIVQFLAVQGMRQHQLCWDIRLPRVNSDMFDLIAPRN